MKKKLLSVLMAGALVATSSVNAFASTAQLTWGENDTKETEITITGNVADRTGAIQPGTLSVTVPTAATFNVSKEGVLTGTSMEVVNNGEQAIDVFAYQFVDTNKNNGIKVGPESELGSNDRTYVSLSLRGNNATAYFKTETEEDERGVYSDKVFEQNTKADATGVKIAANIAKDGKCTLELEGKAGTSGAEITKAEKDTFTLKLKIKKASNK